MKYLVKSLLFHDGKEYKIGSEITDKELIKKQADALIEVKTIEVIEEKIEEKPEKKSKK